MGRRKKESKSVHRENIASAAQILFMKKGIEATSMDDIAKAAGYSKATLYVYFENKEEIAGVLVLESMKKLNACLSAALEKQGTSKSAYDAICRALVRYQEEFPFYFDMALDKINIDFDDESSLPEERDTYRVGEDINEKIGGFLRAGIEKGEIRADIKIVPTIFTFWSMLSGVIQMAAKKEAYIASQLKLSKKDFLEYSFDTLYRSVAGGGEKSE